MNEPAQPPSPRPAATVLLLRASGGGVEVLVIRRHENLAFMGGMWVFPGGAVCPADFSPAILERIPDEAKRDVGALRALNGDLLPEQQQVALAVAAHRETFEETGVLLATTAEGGHCPDDLLKCAQAQRPAVARNPALFADLLAQHELTLDLERLVYWAHWITPSNAPRRFDTRFFVAAVPPEQTASIDTFETVDHAWMTPRALLDAAERQAMPVSQPTLYNLMELDASLRTHGSLSVLMERERNRPIAPVLPKVLREHGTLIVMPWDSEYPSLAGEGEPAGMEYPERLRALPSRMLAK